MTYSRLSKSAAAGCGNAEFGKFIRRGQPGGSVAGVAEDVGQVRQWIDGIRLTRFDQ